MAHIKFQKTALAISSAASLALIPMLSTAQAANDSGQLNFIAQIAATTCVLSLGDTAATKIGSRTLNLGNYTTASTSGIANGATISKGGDAGNGFSLSLKAADGTTACALGTSKWDIGIDHAYGGLGASLSDSSFGTQQYSLSAYGSLVLHEGGVLLAPNVGETFGIVEVPQGKGVSLVGSNVRVNSSGYGVVTNLTPYFMNDVQISLEGASRELEVENPAQKVAPVEGSIVRLKFNSTSGRPLLIVLQTSIGTAVPIGASVNDAQGNEIGTVGQGSRVLLRVKKAKDRLNVVWGDKPNQSCFIEYALDDKKVTTTSGFTNLKLACITEIVAENSSK